MPQTVSLLKGHEIIKVKSWGLVTEAMLVETRDKIERLHQEYGCTMVLVDARQQSSLPGERFIFMFGKTIDFTFSRDIKWGVVISDETNEKILLLKETVENTGVPIKSFHTIEDCIAWLRE
ncbi:MAG: hypothetical protein L3J03_03140 [Desulfobacterales bacterium]|nr:hypothetical protein [Desulfobacterales bacterium]